MVKKILLSSFLSALILPAVSLANPGTWMPTAKNISSIFVEGDDNGKVAILIEGNVPSDYIPAECRSGEYGTFNTIPLNTDKGRGMYSLALAAYTSGKPVTLALSCIGNRPLITHIRAF